MLDAGGKTIWLDPRDEYDATAAIPVGMWGKEGGGGEGPGRRGMTKGPLTVTGHMRPCVPLRCIRLLRDNPPGK